jgi:hypothetical protein
MKADDLIAFFIEEAEHCAINNECTKSTESALAAHGVTHKCDLHSRFSDPNKYQ